MANNQKQVKQSQRATEASAKASLKQKFGSNNLELTDVYTAKLSESELRMIRKTLAKRANQRLVRLERAESTVTGEKFSSYGASEIAYDYIEQTRYSDIEKNEPGKLRFSESFGYDVGSAWDLKREIVKLQTFLLSKSSTVAGQKEIEKKRIKTFESGDWGTDGGAPVQVKFATNKEFYAFLSSKTFDNLVKKGFTSEDIVDVFIRSMDKEDSVEKAKEKMAKALDEFEKPDVKVNLKEFKKQVLGGSSNR